MPYPRRPAGTRCARARYHEETYYLPWFRFKRKKDTQVAPTGAHDVTATPAEPERTQDTTIDSTAAGEDAAARNKRRRGSRGGRGRKRPTTTDGAAEGGTAV